MDWSFLSNFSVFPTAFFSLFWITFMTLLLASMLFGLMDFDMDAEIDADAGSFGQFLVHFGIGKVPLVISMSLVFTVGLAISYFLQFTVFEVIGVFIPKAEGEGFFLFRIVEILLGIVFIFAVFIVSLYISGPICKKIEPIFCRDIEKAFNPIGKECTIITPTVSETYGEARIVDGSKEFVISVYTDSEEDIKIKDVCHVIKKHDERNKYLIKKS